MFFEISDKEVVKNVLDKKGVIKKTEIKYSVCIYYVYEASDNEYKDKIVEYAEQISIYEFIIKCKKWAFEKGYTIESSFDGRKNYPFINYIYKIKSNKTNFETVVSNQSCLKSLIVACKWILEELKTKEIIN